MKKISLAVAAAVMAAGASAHAQTAAPIMGIGTAGALLALGGGPDGAFLVDALKYNTCNEGQTVTADPFFSGLLSEAWNVDNSTCDVGGDDSGEPCSIARLQAQGCAGSTPYLCRAPDGVHFTIGTQCTPVNLLYLTDVVFVLDANNNAIGTLYADTINNDSVSLSTAMGNVDYHSGWLGAGFPTYLISSDPTFYVKGQTSTSTMLYHQPNAAPTFSGAGDDCWTNIVNSWPHIPTCRWRPAPAMTALGYSAQFDNLLAHDSIASDFPVLPGQTQRSWGYGVKLGEAGISSFLTFSTNVIVGPATTPISALPCLFGSNRCVVNQWVQDWFSNPFGIGMQGAPNWRLSLANGSVVGSNTTGNIFPVYRTAKGVF